MQVKVLLSSHQSYFFYKYTVSTLLLHFVCRISYFFCLFLEMDLFVDLFVTMYFCFTGDSDIIRSMPEQTSEK